MPSILTSWARSFVVALSLLALCAPAWAEPKPPAKLDSTAVEPQVFRYKYYAGTKQTYDNKIVQESRVEAKGAPGQVPEGALVTTIDTTFTNTAIKVLPSGEGTQPPSAVVPSAESFAVSMSTRSTPSVSRQARKAFSAPFGRRM